MPGRWARTNCPSSSRAGCARKVSVWSFYGASPAFSPFILSSSWIERGTRAIFYDMENTPRVTPEWPSEAVIRAARVLFVDQLGIAGMTRAARVARQAGIPVVADFDGLPPEAGFSELADLVDHLILSADYAQALTGRTTPAEAAQALWRRGGTSW